MMDSDADACEKPDLPKKCVRLLEVARRHGSVSPRKNISQFYKLVGLGLLTPEGRITESGLSWLKNE